MQRKIVAVNTLNDEEFHMLSWLDESGATNFKCSAPCNTEQALIGSKDVWALWDRYGLLNGGPLQGALVSSRTLKNQD